jgi:D-glycero-alpha-D-manno-heptose-7-phosphate kinase
MKQSYFTINKGSTVREAFVNINNNKLGIIFITNDKNQVLGCATDGDIRDKLLSGVKLDDSINLCCNNNFVHVNENTERELIIKKFDSDIKIIPVLNDNLELVRLLTPNDFPIDKETQVIARSKSPVRISFGGGGSDLTHYFNEKNGAVINATISLFSHATLEKRNDKKIFIFSSDLNSTLKANNLKDAVTKKGQFGLILKILELISPDFGFDLHLRSDYPMNSGLGGSAVIISAIIGCFNEFRIDKWNKYEIAEMAYQSERLMYNISGGWQDQYATVFGGINLIEFKKDNNIINSLRIDDETILELKENLILCDTCISHNSSGIHDDQKKELENKEGINDLVRQNVELTYSIRDSLIKGDLTKFGQQLNQGWRNKKQFSKKISNKKLDEIYNTAIDAGALGGKLLGAGGGGFFLFYCDPMKRWNVVKSLSNIKANVIEFDFETNGLISWKIRKK